MAGGGWQLYKMATATTQNYLQSNATVQRNFYRIRMIAGLH